MRTIHSTEGPFARRPSTMQSNIDRDPSRQAFLALGIVFLIVSAILLGLWIEALHKIISTAFQSYNLSKKHNSRPTSPDPTQSEAVFGEVIGFVLGMTVSAILGVLFIYLAKRKPSRTSQDNSARTHANNFDDYHNSATLPVCNASGRRHSLPFPYSLPPPATDLLEPPPSYDECMQAPAGSSSSSSSSDNNGASGYTNPVVTTTDEEQKHLKSTASTSST